MEVKMHIPFQDLIDIVRELSPSQKAKLQKELAVQPAPAKKSKLTELLLKGPVFSESQIKEIEDTHKSINEWRTK